jgi:hypothetical protein
MDCYTKVILTIIAAALIMITVRLWEPRSAEAVFTNPGPMLGDLIRIQNMQNSQKRKEQMDELADRIPLNYVWFLRDGRLDVFVTGGSLD